MLVPLYIIDAFTGRLFSGNPAAVCPLERWLDDELLRSIAAENNLSETAFYISSNGEYHLRWFTPKVEVDLCGHATLATAHVIFNDVSPGLDRVWFNSASGPLTVAKEGTQLAMDFPARALRKVPMEGVIDEAIGSTPTEVYQSKTALLAIFTAEDDIARISPDFAKIAKLECTGISVSAKGQSCDFVSRFFAPRMGIPEDPVTGSIHCALVPYWSAKLGKSALHARQLSSRGGELYCELRGERVKISGQCVKYAQGHIELPDVG